MKAKNPGSRGDIYARMPKDVYITAEYEPFMPEYCSICAESENVCRMCFIKAVEDELHMDQWLYQQ